MYILAEKPYNNCPEDKDLCIVLRFNPENSHRFITHIYNKSSDKYYEGHYFTDLLDATDDFDSRGVQ